VAPARGSAPVGTATYPVPTDAVMVDTTRGADTNPGTAAAPKKTIQAAVNAATTGKTVVIRAGVYHEQVDILGKSLTVQAYPGEAVWLDGSRAVTGFKPTGTTWTLDGWTAEFDDSVSFTTGRDDATFLNAAHPAAAKPDQVFIDGVQLQQVTTAAQVVPGTFAVDYATDRLILGTDPTGHAVRATDLANALTLFSEKNTIRGIGVRRYATSIPRIGTVRVWSAGNTIRDVVIEDSATVGISFVKADNTGDRLTVVRAGLLGIHGNAADRVRITNSVVQANNYEHFNPAPTSAGIKITRTRGVTIDNVLSEANYSTGIWMDESDYNMTIVNNEVRDNIGGPGMKLELSDTGIVANNRVTGHKSDAILLYNTGNIKVYNNELGTNTGIGIKLWQDARRQAAPGAVGRDPRAPVPDPTVPWITRNITISNNVIDAAGRYQIYAHDIATNIPADAMNITINGNMLTPRPTSTTYSAANMVGWGNGDNKTVVNYGTPETLAAAKNPTWRNASSPTNLPLTDMLTHTPTLAGVAIALPTDIATAIGTTTGTTTLGRITK
jgi:parallel beta-helix repeat protein